MTLASPATVATATPRRSAAKAQVGARRDRRGASQRPGADQLAGPHLRGEPQSSHSGRSGGRRGDESASRQSGGTGRRPSGAPTTKIGAQVQLSGGSLTPPRAGTLPGGRRTTPPPSPAIVPGALARVRPGADTRFAGRSGLVVSVDGSLALVRFAGARRYAFALADLQPVTTTITTTDRRSAAPLLRRGSATGAAGTSEPVSAGRSLPARQAPSSPPGPATRTSGRAGGEPANRTPARTPRGE